MGMGLRALPLSPSIPTSNFTLSKQTLKMNNSCYKFKVFASKTDKGNAPKTRKQNLFESVTEALDFAQVTSAEDAVLIEEARSKTRSGEQMRREQGTQSRKIRNWRRTLGPCGQALDEMVFRLRPFGTFLRDVLRHALWYAFRVMTVYGDVVVVVMISVVMGGCRGWKSYLHFYVKKSDSSYTKMGDLGYAYTLDEALSTIGFGKFQVGVLAYAGLGWIAEAMEMMLLSFVGPAIQPEWGLSSTQESLISTVAFGGMLVGAYSWGVVSDSYGRKKGFIGSTLITGVAGLLSAFAPNYVSLLILRCIVGVGIGCGHVFSSWFLEFVPTPNRGSWMVVFSTFWTVGTIMEASLAWWIMPTYGWRLLLGLSAVPSLVALLCYGLVPESPRYLCTQGRLTEAQYILANGATLNCKDLPKGLLVSDHINESTNEGQSSESTTLISSTKNESNNCQRKPSSIVMLLSPNLIRTTLLLWLLYFGNTFSYYGIVLLTSQLSIGQSECDPTTLQSNNIEDPSLYVNVFITSLAELPGLALAALILDRVGRKISMEIIKLHCCLYLCPRGVSNELKSDGSWNSYSYRQNWRDGLTVMLLPFETSGKELSDTLDLAVQHVEVE
nr:organic cation/carnitine transporter 7-like [Tanacetum cinerariifolium]